MRRLYRCTVIGSGAGEDACRPKVADYNIAWQVAVEFLPGAAVVDVEVTADAAMHELIARDPDIVALP